MRNCYDTLLSVAVTAAATASNAPFVALEMKRIDADRLVIFLDCQRRESEWEKLNNIMEELKVRSEVSKIAVDYLDTVEVKISRLEHSWQKIAARRQIKRIFTYLPCLLIMD